MNQNKYGYIYLTTNLVNNKVYIGQRKSKKFLNERYLGSGKLLVKAVAKYGKENFTVKLLQWCTTADELNEREIFWISEYKRRGYILYNISKGGGVGDTYGMLGKHHSELTKQQISKKLKGRQFSNVTILKMSESAKLSHKLHPELYLHNLETKQKISNSHKNMLGTTTNKVIINNGKEHKFIYKWELPNYISKGWVKGKTKEQCLVSKLNRN